MPITRDKKRGQFVFDFHRTINGQTVRAQKRLPKAWDRAQADAFSRQEEARLYAIATGVQRERPTIDQAVEHYLTDKRGNKTIFATAQEMALVLWSFEGRYIDELPDVARAITKHGVAHSWSDATIRNRIAYLRAACRWAWKQHNLGEHDPGGRVQMPTVRNAKTNFLDRREMIVAARKVANRDARAAMLIGFYSGMRIGEVLRAVPVGGIWVVLDTKNGDDAHVPILPKVAVYARRWPRKLAKTTAQKHARLAMDAIGRTDASFHTLRHSTATAILAAGESLDMVGDILRHKDKRSTQRYAHRQREQMTAAMSKLQKSPTSSRNSDDEKAA